MSDVRNTVLTIGHSTHPLESFIALLRRQRVSAVADVRSAPYSRFSPQFNREPLTEALEAEGIRYVYLGNELGGRSDDPACYEEGQVRYDRILKTERFRSGLARVVNSAAKYRITLMCAEKEPLDCHRTLLVARALNEQGVDVAHVHADGRLEPHQAAMDRLLEIQKLPCDDLYHTREELVSTAVARQVERVAYVDGKLLHRTAKHDS